jgi:4-amino-4-deoxychorismate lyase
MYPFFETIRYKNGVAENLSFHQQRVDFTLLQFNAKASIILLDLIALHNDKPVMDDKVYKCRLQYDLMGNIHIHFKPYSIKKINTVSIHDIGTNDYPYKFSDRTWINEIVAKATTDEVIFTQNGYIKDASYANMVFFDGIKWITPNQPLLMGTRRAELLKKSLITEAPIPIKDLKIYKKLRFINAMMAWEESPIIELENSKGLVNPAFY